MVGEHKTAADRIRSNLQVENNGIAPMYALRKDHKPCEDEIKGPKTRPVCGGSSAYNRKLSHLISMMIRPIWQLLYVVIGPLIDEKQKLPN